MASAPSPSSRPRQTWRDRTRPQETAHEVKLLQRWLASLVLLALVAALAWLIYTFFFQPQTHFACLPVANYGKYRVPPVPFFENDVQFLREFDKQIEVLVTSGESETLDRLTDDLNEKLNLGVNDTLVLYVCAHGVSLARDGKTTHGYLMCGDKVGDDKNGGDSLLEIGEFLDRVRNCKAAHKIILLDAGHITTAPQLGMLVNEFPRYLEEAMQALGQDDKDEKSLWVLSANSMHESSHVVHSKCQSAFNDFVLRGLKGEADVGPNHNGFVDLSELVAFVGQGVRDWVKSQYGSLEHQTPRILWGGGHITTGVIDNQMQRIIVSRAIAPPTSDAKATPKEEKAASAKTVPVRRTRGLGPRWSATMPLRLASGQPALAQAEATQAQPAPADGTPKTDAAPTPAVGTPATVPPAAPEVPKPTSDTKATEKPPATGPQPEVPGPYSEIQAAWRLRDEILKTDLSNGWTPIDFAPHAWRILESSLLDFEVRYRNAIGTERPVFRPEYSAGEFADAGTRYAASRQPAETTGAIYKALRARNRGTYRAIDLVAWHCRASFGRAQKLVQFKPIEDLLRQLQELETTLSVAISNPDDTDRDRLEQKLGGLAESISKSLDSIDESLVGSIEKQLQGSKEGPLPGDVARELEDLLSMPLADTARRMRLLEALARVGERRNEKSTPETDRQLTDDRRPNDVIRDLQDTASGATGTRSALARATEQGLLEWQLLKLAQVHQNSDKQKNLGQLLPQDDAASLKDLAKVGYELREIYRSLPNSSKSEEANPRDADGELRLLPAYQKANFEDSLAVVRKAHWTLPDKRDVRLSSSATSLSLDAKNTWLPLTVRVTSVGNFTGTVQVDAKYDGNKVKLESVNGMQSMSDSQSRTVVLDVDHTEVELTYRAKKAALLQGEEAKLIFRAESPDHPNIRFELPIRIELAAPEDIELVVEPAGGMDGPNKALVSGGPLHYDADSSVLPRRLRVSTFADHKTAFDFKLKHLLPRDRTVEVDLYAVSENNLLRLDELQDLAAENPHQFVQELTGPRAPGKKVAEAKKLLLPKSSSQAVPIEWTAFPPPAPPPKDAPPAATAAPPKSEPERASLVGGLICVVRETGQDSAPWITWVDVAPYAPDQYVAPTVFDQGSGRVRVELGLTASELGLTASARPLDDQPIIVELEESPDIKLPIKPSAKLSPDNKFHDRVEATVTDNGDSKETIEVRLRVDGYPRAFIYRLTPLDRSSAIGKEQWERDLTRIEVVSPQKLDSFPQPDGKGKVPVQVQVTAPSDRFNRNRPFEDQLKDRIEVGIDDDDDDKPNPSVMLTFYSDRMSTLTIDSVGARGRVTIDTKVTDLNFELPCPDLNKHANLVALLKFGDQERNRDRVECIFDNRPPEAPIVPATVVMYLGEKKALKVTASDGEQGSGIKAIHFAYDTLERDDAARKQNHLIAATNNQSEYDVPFSKEWDAPANRQMIVWSVDKVGLESKLAPVLVEVRPKQAIPANNRPAAKFGTIRGQVTFGGRGVPRARVSVARGAGPTKSLERTTKADGDGKFEIKNLPSGDYPLEAEGTASNTTRKSQEPVTVTIPSPPEDKNDVKIALP